MTTYYLAQHGDPFEQHYWSAFLAVQWPSYERFWQQNVVPLTNRPADIHLMPPTTLEAAGFTDRDICCAQLHYTILGHLARAFEVRHAPLIDMDLLTEGLTRLTSAQDVAFELLERKRDSNRYEPWLGSPKTNGKAARSKWQTDHDRPLQAVRNYRNHLIHGRMTPALLANDVYVPRIGRESAYVDWRLVTEGTGAEAQIGVDLVPCRVVLDDAWFQTVSYLESEWAHNFP